MIFQLHPNGYEVVTDYGYAYFSFGNLSWSALQSLFPDYVFDRVKQVHGNRLFESKLVSTQENAIAPEADAIFTKVKSRAVAVATADCVPILILHPEKVFAIHAGWRGVKNEIVLKSLRHLGVEFCANPASLALIGPHILSQSFEVDKTLADEFEQQYQIYHVAHGKFDEDHPVVTPHLTNPNNKAYVNLHAIVVRQLLLAGFRPSQIQSLSIDTFTDTRFASYRRDKDRAGRNFSFVCRA